MAPAPATAPVILVHGWGGSFDRTWRPTGLPDLLADAGRTVVGVDLLGHGAAPKPHDPEAYADLTARVADALPADGTPVDAVGFSLGAITLLELACRAPRHFSRMVLAGIGENVFRRDDEGARRIIAALEGTAPDTDVQAHAFRRYAEQPGNDLEALAAVMRRPAPREITAEGLATITCPVLVIIGDKDFAGPGEPLAAALPDARLVTLRNTDHFATPESFGFIDATLEFLGAVPG